MTIGPIQRGDLNGDIFEWNSEIIISNCYCKLLAEIDVFATIFYSADSKVFAFSAIHIGHGTFYNGLEFIKVYLGHSDVGIACFEHNRSDVIFIYNCFAIEGQRFQSLVPAV